MLQLASADSIVGPRQVPASLQGLSTMERLWWLSWPRSVGPPLVTGLALYGGATLAARVNHGRWVVDCPTCRGAQLASQDDPRFYCIDCFGVGGPAEGMAYGVTFPAGLAAIEGALLARPVANRNWSTGETAIGLQAENAANGVVMIGGS